MLDYIKEKYKLMTKQEMANVLGTTYRKVEWLMRSNNLTKYSSIKYTETEIAFIKKYYPNKGSLWCATRLNRSPNALNKKIKKLGLTINWTYLYIDGNGYLMNCEDRSNRYWVHRKVMETKLGRPLQPGEVVHHIDKNKRNNDPSNLTVMSRSEHIKIHKEDLNEHKI